MNTLTNRAAALTAAFFFGALASPAAQAAARLAVEPVTLTLPAKALATQLKLRNNGGQPVTIQAEVFTWTQDGQDKLAPTRELLVSPAVFKVAPGATQVVRIGRTRAGKAGAQELAYRVTLTEVPPSGQVRPGAISTVLKLSLPVYVPAAEPERGTLAWQAQRNPDDGLALRFTNPGNTHEKVTRLTLLEDGKVIAERDVNVSVLARATREVAWPAALKHARGGALLLRAQLAGRTLLEGPLAVTAAPPAPHASPPAPAETPEE